MITTYQAENTLKSLYLGVMAEQLNTRTNPLFTKIKQTSNDVWGKEIRKGVLSKDSYEVVESDNIYMQYISTLKNLIVQIEIPEKVMSNCSNKRAFVDLLNESVDCGFMTARKDISEMLYGDATKPYSLTGIGAIFDTARPLYGLDREMSPILTPIIKEVNEINDIVIEQTIDELAERGAKTDYIAVSQDVKYKFIEYMSSLKRNIDILEIEDGFKTLSFNGIPLVYDKYVPQGCMYLLDTSVFALHSCAIGVG